MFRSWEGVLDKRCPGSEHRAVPLFLIIRTPQFNHLICRYEPC